MPHTATPATSPGNPPPGARHRVVITGAGIITALGSGWSANARGFRTGTKAFQPVTLFDVSRQRARSAAMVTLPASPAPGALSPRILRRLDRASHLLLHAALEAWHMAGWCPSEDLPFILGTTSCGMRTGEDFLRAALNRPGSRRRQPTRIVHYLPQQQALEVANVLGFAGPVTLIANACASGANAVGHAFHLVRSGAATRALCGGYDALSQLVFAGFDALQALSTTTCRPFDARRDGLSLGEGAAILALETLESARARSAAILGELLGYGSATDVHHLTQPHPAGDAALAAMKLACDEARVRPGEIDYVNAHGTGTPLNDAAEAAAINRWAGVHAASIPVSSTKAGIGHLLGAAGAVETVVCLMSLVEQWLPPQPGTLHPDPACTFPLVLEPRDARVRLTLTNSFGFGGANASLVLGTAP